MHKQKEVFNWASRVFGDPLINDNERAARVIEEAAEIAQCLGLSRERLDRIVDRTYNRPKGKIDQELGGMIITLETLAEYQNVNLREVAELEWQRVISKPQRFWDKVIVEKLKAETAFPEVL